MVRGISNKIGAPTKLIFRVVIWGLMPLFIALLWTRSHFYDDRVTVIADADVYVLSSLAGHLYFCIEHESADQETRDNAGFVSESLAEWQREMLNEEGQLLDPEWEISFLGFGFGLPDSNISGIRIPHWVLFIIPAGAGGYSLFRILRKWQRIRGGNVPIADMTFVPVASDVRNAERFADPFGLRAQAGSKIQASINVRWGFARYSDPWHARLPALQKRVIDVHVLRKHSGRVSSSKRELVLTDVEWRITLSTWPGPNILLISSMGLRCLSSPPVAEAK